MRQQVVNQWLVAVLLIAMAGCGYRFAGQGQLPAGVSRVFVDILDNRTTVSGLERMITNDLIDEFTRRREESLEGDRSQADAVLTGIIVRLTEDSVARTSISAAAERRVAATVNLRLESPDGRVLWSSGNVVERQDYAVVEGDETATDRNRSAAIAALSRRLAETAFNRLTDDF